jgi:phosphonopyruvate decarboxylase
VSATAKETGFIAKDALVALHRARDPRDIVVTTMAPARDWMTLTPQSPLDIVFVPSAMGHATSLGLGLALAQPDRRVIVCNGDGSMLMNLGSLVTIVGAGATNLIVLVFQNGVYEVTGAQPMPAEADFATIARGAGFASVFEFSNSDEWASKIDSVLDARGPVFAVLRVAADVGIPGPKSPGPAGERARLLRGQLADRSNTVELD